MDWRDSFKDKRIAVIGDLMIDAYIWGDVHRMSPEAPVPVVEVTKREVRLGGAGNVALNLASLGAKPILISVCGTIGRGAELKALLTENGMEDSFIVYADDRQSTIKTRVISDGEHKLRVDEEQTDDITPLLTKELLSRVQKAIDSGLDGIILQDYNKGVLTEEVIEAVINKASSQNVLTIVDPKKKNFMAYANCSLFKPNMKELNEGLGLKSIRLAELDAAVAALQSKMPHERTLITLSEHGVYYNQSGCSEHIPAHPRKIVDVSGAGDTVVATCMLGLASGMQLEEVARLSNLAGGMVCEHVGVVPIDGEALYEEYVSIGQKK